MTCRIEEQDGKLFAQTRDFSIDLTLLGKENELSSYINREVVLGIRPEDVCLANENHPMTAKAEVKVIEQMGSSTILYVNTGNQLITMEMSGNFQSQIGDLVSISFPIRRIYMFDQDNDNTFLFPQME
jgi:multiple sugar transport system ATP-binding protein